MARIEMPSAVRSIELHGHSVTYRELGEGPPLILLHGITASSECWSGVIEGLAEGHTVIAPDLLGHGASDKGRGDYSLGAFASTVRDLMQALGLDSATIAGHSLGGGVAMQFAYQFPERVERLVLVSSGGLGREVHPLLRAAALPGSDFVLPALARTGALGLGARAGRWAKRAGLHPSPDLQGMADGVASLQDDDASRAFLHTARSILDLGGQRVDASDRLHLADGVPTLIVWGERDRMIPVAHGRRAHERIAHSRLEVFAGAGHFPFRDAPVRFVNVLTEFIATTQPAAPDRAGAAARRDQSRAA